ncbi:MAG: sigma-70 family RNA polymerase sigma factor [Pirellulaceae bacterium]|nr:sigma-70 family RNA polymerase sigma factor [Pirellulaceae bacterium]
MSGTPIMMSGFDHRMRFSSDMALTQQEVLRILMKARDRIAAAAWVVVHDAQLAEDIFQNVVIKTMTKEVEFDVDGAVLSWAFVTARREGIDWLRRQKKEVVILDVEIMELFEREWLTESQREDSRSEALRACLRQLPRKSAELLRLRYFEGLACSRIAERLETRIDAIYKRLSRLHQSLKDCVEKRLGDPEVLEA